MRAIVPPETPSERKSRLLLEGNYSVARRTWFCPWTFIAVRPTEVLLLKVTDEKWPTRTEMALLRKFLCPPNCRKLIHRWRKGRELPDVLTFDGTDFVPPVPRGCRAGARGVSPGGRRPRASQG